MFRVAIFFIAAGCLGSVQAVAEIIENRASVCFDSKGSRGLVSGRIRPLGCFSSSCTRTVERRFSISANIRSGEIRITSRFVLENNGNKICTSDCGGGGSVIFDLRHIHERRYKVLLGVVQIGELDLTKPLGRVCMGTRR